MRLIGVRAFLRGGYLDREHPQLVMRHNRPQGLWIPFDDNGVPVRDPRLSSLVEPFVPNREGPTPWWFEPPAVGEER